MANEYITSIIEDLSKEYDLSVSTIKKYLTLLRKKTLFVEDDVEECLTLLCEDRANELEEVRKQIEYNKTHHMIRKIKTKKLDESVNEVIERVYGDLIVPGIESFDDSRIYDETDYDVMERDDQLESTLNKYLFEEYEIKQKDKAAYQKIKKKNNTQK